MAIRWGIIGCGDVARKRVAGAIQNDLNSELVAVCRRDESKLREFAEEFGVSAFTTSAEEVIESADVDAVYIATPVNLHCPQTIAAAAAGKHVLVEKPMAMSTAECNDMITACAQADVRLGVAYYRPFYPVVHRMQELIQAVEIGKVLSVSATTCTPFAIDPGEDGYWRVLPEAGGGGVLMDIGSHRLDLFVRMFGPVSDVKAQCGTVAADYQADDVATLALRFESGIHGVLHCCFGASTDPDEFAILGTRGRLVSRPLNDGELIIERGREQLVEQHPPASNFTSPLIEEFSAAILESRPPFVSGEAGRDVNLVMEQAYASAQQ
ncbi:MAG: Gfo/Idh/MocA family protein [Planctomycetales bacterium]|jgi:predicted dehydrogenase